MVAGPASQVIGRVASVGIGTHSLRGKEGSARRIKEAVP